MKKTSFVILFFCLVSSLFAQSQEERRPGSFSAFSLGGSFNVELQEGSEEKVQIVSSDIPMDEIITEIEGNTLKVYRKKGRYGKANVKVLVIYKQLESISAGGSGSISAKNIIKANKFDLTLAGSGNINLDLRVSSLTATLAGSGNLRINAEASAVNAVVAGSGNMQLSGNADKQNYEVSGSGNINAENCKGTEATALVAGSGRICVNVSDKIKASVTGSGDVRYKGNPRIESKITGSGNVKAM